MGLSSKAVARIRKGVNSRARVFSIATVALKLLGRENVGIAIKIFSDSQAPINAIMAFK